MNFLQLVNRAMVEAGTGQTSPMLTLAGSLNLEQQRFVNWVATAYEEIQTDHPGWEFLRATVQLTTVALTPSYSLATVQAMPGVSSALTTSGIASYIPKTFRAWHQAQGVPDEQIMNYMQWDTFRNIYRYATMRTTYNRPVIIAVDPLKTLWFGPVPDDVYTVECEVYQLPQVIALDADTPMMPPRWHMAIVWKALIAYAAFESAPEVMARASQNYEELMNELRQDRMVIPHMGPPLA